MASSSKQRTSQNSRSQTPSTSRPQFIYSSSHSRSKSHLPHPKVLPFPDLPVRPISREGSRGGSPIPSPRNAGASFRLSAHDAALSLPSSLGAGGAGMMQGWSSDGVVSVSPPEARTSPVHFASSASPPISSPLASAPSPYLLSGVEGSSRARFQTGPSDSSLPVRTEGFHPALSPVQSTTSAVPTQTDRSPALPTSTTSPTSTERPRPVPPVKKPSNPQATTRPAAGSISISPPALAQPLMDHLYASFLNGTCADVRLTVRKWGVGWLVHRMVLVQAGFFYSLFLRGFSESSPAAMRASRKGKERATDGGDDWDGHDIELKFDDPNITRAAFEICLSRLYSPYPHLQFPVALLSTPSNPLTASFAGPSAPIRSMRHALPPHHHLATPRLLLSLLATTSYLGHGALMREALSMVLRTVGPVTVGRYLGFAIGDGVGEEEWHGQNAEGARALEGVARPLQQSQAENGIDHALGPEISPTSFHRNSADSSFSAKDDDDRKVGDSKPSVTRTTSGASELTYRAHHLALGQFPATPSPTSPDASETASALHASMPHFYGYASNKIGESCVCWLARWGIDVLAAEVTANASSSSDHPPFRIWAQGGLPARFVRALLSSDSLFVKDEIERYQAARQVLDLRRRGWEREMEAKGDLSTGTASVHDEGMDEWEEDEAEMGRVFAEGIYYSHMTFGDLSMIAADIDSSTSLPFAPLPVLQAAHWAAADLRAKVSSYRIGGGSPSDDPALGLTQTSEQIASQIARSRRATPRSRVDSPASGTWTPTRGSAHVSMSNISTHFAGVATATYHPVPTDDTHRVGASGLLLVPGASSSSSKSPLTGPSMPGLPDLGPHDLDRGPDAPPDTSAPRRPHPQSEKTFFGLLAGSRQAHEIAQLPALDPYFPSVSDGKLSARWTRTEPFRFAVEFWGIENLAEKERLYSTTHFHAGSWWNVYVQTIRKKDKGLQLGIYLHRQNPGEPVPRPSSPLGGGGMLDAHGKGMRGGVGARWARPGFGAAEMRPQSTEPDLRRATLPRSAVSASAGGEMLLDRERHRELNVAAAASSRGSLAALAGGASGIGVGGESGMMRETSIEVVEGGRRAGAAGIAALGQRDVGLGSGYVNGGVREGGGEGGSERSDEGYRDTRRVTKAYFSISCASALGTALTRFTSAPDSFALSQSWGWKSSALRSGEYLITGTEPAAAGGGSVSVRSGEGTSKDDLGASAMSGLPAGLEDERLDGGVLGWLGEVGGGGGQAGLAGSLRATVVVGVI